MKLNIFVHFRFFRIDFEFSTDFSFSYIDIDFSFKEDLGIDRGENHVKEVIWRMDIANISMEIEGHNFN